MLKVHIVTIFPELFDNFLALGMVGRAVRSSHLVVDFFNPREFGIGNHRAVDDTPYGGGSGMVMRVDCIVQSLEKIEAAHGPSHRVLLGPSGTPFRQSKAKEFAKMGHITIICGRYEGLDDRVRAFIDEEVSIGDFILTGGEIAAMAIIEASVRLIDGVLGNNESATHESFSEPMNGLLEYPQYTRPVSFRGMEVPAVLKEGNHREIAAWRHQEAVTRTQNLRNDLWEKWQSHKEKSS